MTSALLRTKLTRRPRLAVIGGGWSGLTLAHALKSFADVVIFEQKPFVGGRFASYCQDGWQFDYGGQCFTVRNPEFKSFLEPWWKRGLIQEWTGKVYNIELPSKRMWPRIWKERHYVFTPTMHALCEDWGRDLNIRFCTEVYELQRLENLASDDGRYRLRFYQTSEHSERRTHEEIYDGVLAAMPAKPSRALFQSCWKQPEPALDQVSMHPGYVLMVGWKRSFEMPWIALKPHDYCLKWISVDSSKPGRSQQSTCFVAHASNSWSRKYRYQNDAWVKQNLLEAFYQVVEGVDHAPDEVILQYWDSAVVGHGVRAKQAYWSPSDALGSTSDWAASSRIEEVWVAAQQLAQQVQQTWI